MELRIDTGRFNNGDDYTDVLSAYRVSSQSKQTVRSSPPHLLTQIFV